MMKTITVQQVLRLSLFLPLASKVSWCFIICWFLYSSFPSYISYKRVDFWELSRGDIGFLSLKVMASLTFSPCIFHPYFLSFIPHLFDNFSVELIWLPITIHSIPIYFITKTHALSIVPQSVACWWRTLVWARVHEFESPRKKKGPKHFWLIATHLTMVILNMYIYLFHYTFFI